MRTEHEDILEDIAEEKALTDDISDKLKAALDDFAKTFA